MNARAWFATESFHHEETPRPDFRTDDCRSLPRCRRGLDDTQCEVRCCVVCDTDERVGDDERCTACLLEQVMADEDRRLQPFDDRTAADRFYDRWKAAREDGR